MGALMLPVLCAPTVQQTATTTRLVQAPRLTAAGPATQGTSRVAARASFHHAIQGTTTMGPRAWRAARARTVQAVHMPLFLAVLLAPTGTLTAPTPAPARPPRTAR